MVLLFHLGKGYTCFSERMAARLVVPFIFVLFPDFHVLRYINFVLLQYGATIDGSYADTPGPDDLLECIAYDCPDRMKKGDHNLFLYPPKLCLRGI